MSTARVRGVESCGMLCSAYDLGWSSTADGAAIELPGSAVAGDACPEQPPSEVLLSGAVLAGGTLVLLASISSRTIVL